MQFPGRGVGLLADQLSQTVQIDLDHRRPATGAWGGFAGLPSPLHHATHPGTAHAEQVGDRLGLQAPIPRRDDPIP